MPIDDQNSSPCPDCGAPIPPGRPKGLCATCALQGALRLSDGESQAPPFEDNSNASAPPPVTPAGRLPTFKYFGDYELLEEIARGGMGVVYKARQVSLNRVVAVKLLLRGEFASEDFIKRFRIEASAAAALQHPNIVAIHEVGVHQGHHYFAMDLVDGPNLAQLLRDGPLPAKRAAAYVKTIAEAIHFAHTRRILHRDLKPSNVLIDANNQPWVTDFGLAKQLAETGSIPSDFSSREATDATERNFTDSLTLSGQVLGSPAYMPPEQASGQREKVGVTSDVYSLGAILYHALTGRPPFAGNSVADILKQVENTEPITPRLLNSGVPPDLATICLKCLEKEPAKRYPTARELAVELGRVLNDEPIHARRVGIVGKLWRWSNRKPALASLSAMVLILLLAGTAVGTWLAVHAKRAERQAQTEAMGSDQVALFLTTMLSGVRPSVSRGRDVTILREMMGKAELRLTTDGLKNQPRARVSLLNALGAAYGELGEYEKAASMFRQGLVIEEGIHGRAHPHVAASLESIAQSEFKQGNFAQADRLFRDALEIEKAVPGPSDSPAATQLMLASVLVEEAKLAEAEFIVKDVLKSQRQLYGEEDQRLANALQALGFILMRQKHLAEADTNLTRSLILRQRGTNSESDSASTLSLLAYVRTEQGRLDEAEQMLHRVLEQRKRLHGEGSLEVADSLNVFGVYLLARGKLDESVDILKRSLAVREKHFGTNHPAVALSLHNLGAALLAQAKPVEAEEVLARALAIRRERLEPEHPEIAETMSNLGFAMAHQERIAEAEVLFRGAINLRRRVFGNSDPKAIDISYSLGRALFQQEKWAEAELVARDILRAHQESASPNPDMVAILNNLALVTARRGDLEEAKELIERAFAEQKRLPVNQQTNMLEPNQAFVQLLVATDKTSEGGRIFDDLAAHHQTATGEPDKETINAFASFAAALEQRNNLAEAAKRYRTALELSETIHGVEHEMTAQLRFQLGEVLAASGAIPEAIELYQAALSFWDKSLTHDPRLFQSLMRLGELLCKRGRLAEAKKSFVRGLEMSRQHHGGPHAQVAQSLYRAGNAFAELGADAEAEPLHLEAYEMRRTLFGDNNLVVADSLGCLGYLKRNEPKEAEKLFAQEVGIRDKLAPNDADTGNAHRNLSLALNRAGHADEAKAQMEMALTVGRKAWTKEPLKLAQTITGVAGHLARDKQHEKAEPLMLEAIRIIQTNQQATAAEKRTQIEIIWKFYVDWAVAVPGSGKMQEALNWRKQLTELEERLKVKQPVR